MWEYIIIGFVVIVVGGVIIGGLYRICESIHLGDPPPSHPINRVQITSTTNIWDATDGLCPGAIVWDSWYIGLYTAYTGPHFVEQEIEENTGLESQTITLTNRLLLQFGMQDCPWIQIVPSTACPAYNGDSGVHPMTVTGTTNDYAFTVAGGGMVVTLHGSTTNSSYTYTLSENDTNIYSMAVQRATSFNPPNWQPLCTNKTYKGDVVNFCDTNAPPMQAFYRSVCLGTNVP